MGQAHRGGLSALVPGQVLAYKEWLSSLVRKNGPAGSTAHRSLESLRRKGRIGGHRPEGVECFSNRWLLSIGIAFVMSSIQATGSPTSQAATIQTLQQINTALLRKSLDVQEQTGEAINHLLQQAVEVQKQISKGYLDVRF